MKVSELITHLQQLPQDAKVVLVINEASGETRPLEDIIYEQFANEVVFDTMPPLIAGHMHYKNNRRTTA